MVKSECELCGEGIDDGYITIFNSYVCGNCIRIIKKMKVRRLIEDE